MRFPRIFLITGMIFLGSQAYGGAFPKVIFDSDLFAGRAQTDCRLPNSSHLSSSSSDVQVKLYKVQQLLDGALVLPR